MVRSATDLVVVGELVQPAGGHRGREGQQHIHEAHNGSEARSYCVSVRQGANELLLTEDTGMFRRPEGSRRPRPPWEIPLL